MKIILQFLTIIWIAFFSTQLIAEDKTDQVVSIGVLAFNGEQKARARWLPTADYLALHIPDFRFEIVPLVHEDFVHAINKGQLDFILTNPGHYIILEVKYGATRIATFKSRFEDQILTQFSSVIFTRSDSNLKTLQDLSGHSLAAVSKDAFGGFQLAQAEFLDQEINVYDDLNPLWLGFPQTDIVTAVLAGKVDAGTVRTGILEKLAAKGEINLSNIRILAKKESVGFPLLHSTRLYPEWPMARLPNTDAKLAKQVAITLLQMPEDAQPALASGGAGWTIPLDYLNVHELFRRLQIDPYTPVPLELKEFWSMYRQWVFLIAMLFMVCIFAIFYTFRINQQLKHSQQTNYNHREKLEDIISARTAELSEVNQALQQDIESRIHFENTLHEGCEILQTIYTISNRNDLTRIQRIQSIVDLARQYFAEEVAVFSVYDENSFTVGAFSPSCDSLSVPLSCVLAMQVIDGGQVIYQCDSESSSSYLACSNLIAGKKHGLLEFASDGHDSREIGASVSTVPTELGMRILRLLTQWLSNEFALLDSERGIENHLEQIRLRFADITSREKEVLQLVADGESNKSIARKLNISAKTVELHRANLVRKTNSNSSVQLIKFATAANLVN